MAKYLDARGKEWVLSVTVNTVRRVKAKTGEDLSRAVEGDFLSRLSRDAVLLGSVLWAMVEDQAGDVTEDQFYEGLAGDALDLAAEAFLGALVDFFPKPRRELLKTIVDAGRKAQEQAYQKAQHRIGEMLSGEQSTTWLES